MVICGLYVHMYIKYRRLPSSTPNPFHSDIRHTWNSVRERLISLLIMIVGKYLEGSLLIKTRIRSKTGSSRIQHSTIELNLTRGHTDRNPMEYPKVTNSRLRFRRRQTPPLVDHGGSASISAYMCITAFSALVRGRQTHLHR